MEDGGTAAKSAYLFCFGARVAIMNSHLCALAMETRHNRFADSFGGAGDQDFFAS